MPHIRYKCNMIDHFSCIRNGDPDASCLVCDAEAYRKKAELRVAAADLAALTDEEFFAKFGNAGMKQKIDDQYKTVKDILIERYFGDSFAQAQKWKTTMAQIPPNLTLPSPSPGMPGRFSIATQKGNYKGGRSNAQALQLAQQNGWDVVVPEHNELFLDFDDEASYDRYLDAKSTFETNIYPIVTTHVAYSKSGDPHRRHVYVVLEDTVYLSDSDRISFQLMLQSDPVREMLSWARYLDGDAHPTLFFELPGRALRGRVIQSAAPAPTYVALPVSGSNGTPGIGGSVSINPIPTQRSSTFQPAADPDDPTRYPHKCGQCGGPAYVGLLKTDCKNGCK